LVIMIPDSVQLNEPDMQAVNRFVEQVCGEVGVPFIDMTPVLEAEDDHPSLYLFPIDAHNSPKGLKLIAKSIADYIMEIGFFVNALPEKTT
ncbi:MAG: SGNH/GDSL hydrolase family protein, partial [Deltaproteobacteria bacterium]|nr:SGNH/GDSL hydrolase family protein [Deltaproteobacteria bacterium]